MRHLFKFWKKGVKPFSHWHQSHAHHHDAQYLSPVPSLPAYHSTEYMRPNIPPSYHHEQPMIQPSVYHHGYSTVQHPPSYHHVPPVIPPSAYHHEQAPAHRPPIHYNIYQNHKTVQPAPVYHGRQANFDRPLGLGNPNYQYNQDESVPNQYPSTTETKCGSNALVGCEPIVQEVPCYDYQYPAYHAPSYPSYHASAYPNYQVPVHSSYNVPPQPLPPQSRVAVHFTPGPPYEAANLQLTRPYVQNQNNTNKTNQTITTTTTEPITNTTLKSNSSEEQTTVRVLITTTDQSSSLSKSPSLAESSLNDTIESNLEQMQAQKKTPEQQKLIDEAHEAHLERFRKFRLEADHKIKKAIERSMNGASDEFDGQSSEYQSNRI